MARTLPTRTGLGNSASKSTPTGSPAQPGASSSSSPLPSPGQARAKRQRAAVSHRKTLDEGNTTAQEVNAAISAGRVRVLAVLKEHALDLHLHPAPTVPGSSASDSASGRKGKGGSSRGGPTPMSEEQRVAAMVKDGKRLVLALELLEAQAQGESKGMGEEGEDDEAVDPDVLLESVMELAASVKRMKEEINSRARSYSAVGQLHEACVQEWNTLGDMVAAKEVEEGGDEESEGSD